MIVSSVQIFGPISTMEIYLSFSFINISEVFFFCLILKTNDLFCFMQKRNGVIRNIDPTLHILSFLQVFGLDILIFFRFLRRRKNWECSQQTIL